MTSPSSSTVGQSIDVEAARQALPVLQQCLYLNAGGIGPSPRPVTDVLVRLAEQVSAEGPDGMAFAREEFTQAQATRERVARFLGAVPLEIAITRSTAEGFNIVGHGLSWAEGDEIIFGGADHPAARAVWTILAQRYGVRPIRVDLREDSPEAMLDDVRRLITPRTKLISVSHVHAENGLRVSGRALADLAHAHGARLMLDGCQAVGQFPVDVHALDCDYYAAGAYKWLLGPFGTGFLYVRHALIDELRPSWVGAGGTLSFDPETATWEPMPGAQRFEFGARYWPLVPAMGAAIDFVSAVGLDAIAARSEALVDRLCRQIETVPRLVNFTPVRPDMRTGTVAVAIDGMPGTELVDRLRSRGMRLRVNKGPDGITGARLCLAFFLRDEEVDAVGAALREIAAGG